MHTVLGVICMMPWDMMTTVKGYWDHKFRNTTIEEDMGFVHPPHSTAKEPGWDIIFIMPLNLAS